MVLKDHFSLSICFAIWAVIILRGSGIDARERNVTITEPHEFTPMINLSPSLLVFPRMKHQRNQRTMTLVGRSSNMLYDLLTQYERDMIIVY